MTPWDTGWVKETTVDTTNHSGSGWTQGSATIGASNLVVSSPKSCNLRTYAACGNQAGTYGAASASAYVSITQTFNPISNCLFKASLIKKYFVERGRKYNYCIKLCINSQWEYFGFELNNIWTEICTTVVEPDTISGIKFMSRSSGGGAGAAGWGSLDSENVYIDNVQLTELGVEEKPSILNSKLEIFPNPFIHSTTIKFNVGNRQACSFKIYDLSGNLHEQTNNPIIGKNLKTGIYFIKVRNYTPLKIIKIKE